MVYDERIKTFQQRLAGVADAAFLPISADLQYLTGVPRDIPNFGWTLHPGAWLEGIWLTPQHAPVLTLPRMTAEFGGLDALSDVNLRVLGDWDNPQQLVTEILAGFKLPTNPTVAIGDRTHGETVIALQAILTEPRFTSATELLRQQRVIKSEEEIAIMRQAGAVTEAAFADVLPRLKHGMTELDVISEVNYQLRRHGSLGESFTTSLYNSGPNHPLIFGHREGKSLRELHPPVAILFDFGAIYNGFCYDYGRTVAFGTPDAEFERVFNLVMQAQAEGVAALRAGQATCEQVDSAARQVIEEAGYGAEFRHRLGHGIGMDVHEPPFLTKGNTTLVQEGMMFTVEPSIMIFDRCSARVEDVVVVRPDGGEKLTSGHQTLYVVD